MKILMKPGPFLVSAIVCAGIFFCPQQAVAGTHTITSANDVGGNAAVPVTDHPMVTLTSSAASGGNDATDATVSIGGSVLPVDVAGIRVYYNGVLEGQVTNPLSLTGIVIDLPGNTKGGRLWEFNIDLNGSAGGKTFNLTVTSVGGTVFAGVLPFTTADYTATATGCTDAQPTVTLTGTIAKTGCRNSSVDYTFTVTNNCSVPCGNETFDLTYSHDAAGFTTGAAPTTISLDPGQTSAEQTVTVNLDGTAVGPNQTTVFADLVGHPQGASTEAVTSVDLTGPTAVSRSCAAISNSQIDVTFGAPESGVLLVRGPAGSCPGFTPNQSQSYTAGTQGSDEIVYVGATSPFSDSPLSADTTYCYQVWAYDTCFNYTDSGTTSCTTPAAGGDTITVGNGSDPGDASLCPGDAETDLDAFTLDITTGTDTVTAVTVDFAAGTAGSIQQIRILSGDGGTEYGTLTASPDFSDPQNVPLNTSSITVGTTPADFKVVITPKDHSMTPGSYPVTGVISAITYSNGANSASYSDSGSATVTIDNEAPSNTSWVSINPGDGQVDLSWNTAGADNVVILRSTTPGIGSPEEGTGNPPGGATQVYSGTGTTHTDSTVSNGTPYYYKIFVRDDPCFNFSSGVEDGPYTPTGGGGPVTVTIRSNGKCNDGGTWTWTGTELGDQNDGTIAEATAGGQQLGSCMADNAAYNCKSIISVEIVIRAVVGQGGANESLDFGPMNGGTPYYSGSPIVPTDIITDFPFTWTTRPWDNQPWTYADVDALEVAIISIANGQWRREHVAEVWANVTYDSGSNTCATLLIGNGIDPANPATKLCPETAAVELDGFTFQMSTGSSPVTAVEVTLDSGWEGVGSVEITTSGDVSLGSAAPGSAVVNVPVSGLTATTSETPYKVWVAPRSHASMPIPQGATYSVTGTVSGATVGAAIDDQDTTSATVTIDNLSPDVVTGLTGTPGDTEVLVEWTNPGGDFFQAMVVQNQGAPVSGSPNEGAATFTGTGSIVFTGAASSYNDPGLTNGSSYYYAVFAQDDCGNWSTIASTGPHTPVSLKGLVVVSNTADKSSCTQLTVVIEFTADSNGNSETSVIYDTDPGFASATTACALLEGPSPRQCIIPGLTPEQLYYVQVNHTDTDGVTGTNPEDIPVTMDACGTDSAPPTVLFLSPSAGAVMGGTDRVRAQIYDEGGLASVDPVAWSVDGSALSTSISVNTNYDSVAENYFCRSADNCFVYEFDLFTGGYSNGSHYITVQATDADGNVGQASQQITVSNEGVKPKGDGFLLRRSHGSQLCVDCHNIQTHSSQSSSSKHGNWAIDCMTCHIPHGDTNVYLVRDTIKTPSSGNKTINLQSIGTTDTNVSFLGSTNGSPIGGGGGPAGGASPNTGPFDDGVCEACHTKTGQHRNDGSVGSGHEFHNGSGLTCIDCHSHTGGFGAPACNGCHFAPPTVGKHGIHDEVGTLPTSYDNLNSTATASEYGFACKKCHNGGHINQSADPNQVEVVFDATIDPKNADGSYLADATKFTDVGPSGNFEWSDGSCSNLYCHSIGQRAMTTDTPDYKTVTWDQPASLACNSCHDAGGAATTLSNAHVTHTNDGAAAENYQIGCVRCHSNTVSTGLNDIAPGVVSNKIAHVDGQRSIVFDASGVNNSGGTWDDGAQTCSNTYCHSTGQDRNEDADNSYSSGASIDWTATASCTSCHQGADSTALSGPHAGHTGTTNSVTDEALGCVNCHSLTVADNLNIATASNHVNGLVEVLPKDYDGSDGTFTPGSEQQGQCSNIYCHSTGQDPLAAPAIITYHTPTWSETAPGGDTCRMCHGRDQVWAGAPTYANGGTGADDANSHGAHYSNGCRMCHFTTVQTEGQIVNPGLHLDAARQLVFDAGNSNTSTAVYDAGTKSCSSLGTGCHGAATWGGPSLVCLDCHGDPTTDVDDWIYGNDILAKVAEDEWAYSGHGESTGPNFGGPNPCLYCHSTLVGHGLASNPFRLRNVGAGVSADDWAGNCLACHGTSSPGVDPDVDLGGNDYTPINGSQKVDSYHHGANHQSAGTNGGKFCWDCHDPHGDQDAGGGNIKMVHVEVTKQSDGTYGIPSTQRVVSFTANAVLDDFVNRTNDGGGGNTKICNTCHTSGNVAHFTSTTGDTHQSGYTNGTCTFECHLHTQAADTAFGKPQGGPLNCTSSDCHDSTNSNARRDVSADFGKRSHHAYDNAWGSTLDTWDCITCHAEVEDFGDFASTTYPTAASHHTNGKIELWDTDDGAAFFTYDVDAIKNDGGIAGVDDWGSGNAEWVTQTSTALDPFCLSCHDSDGATATFHPSGSALNPFADSVISNTYDQMVRPRITDIRSKVDTFADNPSPGAEYRDQPGEPRYDEHGVDLQPDPPDGIYARHAIRGFSVSTYTTQHPNWTNGANDLSGVDRNFWVTTKFNWNDTSVMGCADCHTVDGANTTSGNAHGSNSEYLLKDINGAATDGTYGALTYVCYRCHDKGTYTFAGRTDSSGAAGGEGHTNNGSDWVEPTLDLTGTARKDFGKGASMFRMACMNCHGGFGFGSIHGTSDVMVNGTDSSARLAYRFTNGASMRFYDPEGWTGTTRQCYTLARNSGDQWGNCIQHSGGSGSKTRVVQRDLSY